MSTVRLLLHERQPLTALDIHYQGFLLDREAARCTPKTMTHYAYTVGNFVGWLEAQGIDCPSEITAQHMKAYLVNLQRQGLKDTTQHAHARGIETSIRWLVNEGEPEDSPMRKL